MTEVGDQAETWRPIPGTAGAYEASDRGRVRVVTSATAGRPVRPDGVLMSAPNQRGRPVVSIRLAGGRQVARSVPMCVLLAFVGPRPSPQHRATFVGPDRSDLSPANLQWQSPLESLDTARANGRGSARAVRLVDGRRCYLCRRCREWKPVGKFHRLKQTFSVHGRPNSRCERNSECRSCNNAQRVERRRAARANGGRMPTALVKAEPHLAELDRFAGAVDAGGLSPGGRVARARLHAGLTRAELARRAGLKPNTVDRGELDVQVPRPGTLRKLLDVLAAGAGW